MKQLFLLLAITGLMTTVGKAETVTLTTYYPAPYGAYDRLRLIPRETLSNPCQVGIMYVNELGHLQYCAPTQENGEWAKIGTRLEQGSVQISNKEPYAISFKLPFSDLPLIQIYLEADIKTDKGTKKSIINYTSNVTIFDVSRTGFKIHYIADDEQVTLYWVAVGN